MTDTLPITLATSEQQGRGMPGALHPPQRTPPETKEDDEELSDLPLLIPVYPHEWLREIQSRRPINDATTEDTQPSGEPLMDLAYKGPIDLYPIRYPQVC